jgi:hypothetical protein
MSTAGHRLRMASSLKGLRKLAPMSLRYRVWQHRMLQSAQGVSTVDVERLFAKIEAAIDHVGLRRLRTQMREMPDLEELSNHGRGLRIAIVKAFVMGLHIEQRLRILDIGRGAGYFVTVCRYLGHTCDGTEVPIDHLPPQTAAVYAKITAALGHRDEQRLLIEAHRPLALKGTYELINAQRICFNAHFEPTEWSVPQWKFFIEDARRFLASGGRIALELNENVGKYGLMRWYDTPLRDYFVSVGTVTNNSIHILGRL